MKNKVYVVTATRVLSKHFYNVGVFNKKSAAQKAATTEDEFRGGKYSCMIEEWIMGKGIAGKCEDPSYPKRIPVK